MKRLFAAAFSAFLLFPLGSGTVQAQTPFIAGNWEVSWDMPNGTRTITLDLQKEGNVLSGTAHIPSTIEAGVGEDQTWDTPISDGRIDGDHIFFRVPLEDAGSGSTERILQFTGVVGSTGIMGGFLTGASMMQGVMDEEQGNSVTEIPFKGFRRK